MSLDEFNLKEVIDAFSIEKNLTKQDIILVIEQAIKDVWLKTYGDYDLVVKINDYKISLFQKMKYVEKVTNPKREILATTNNINEEVLEEIFLQQLPRIDLINIIQNIKNNLNKKQMEKEYMEFKDQEGKLFKCKVVKNERNGVIVRVNGNYNGILPYNLIQDNKFMRKKIRFFPDEIIYCRLEEVKNKFDDSNSMSLYMSKYQLIFERKSTDFVKLILKDMLPEIQDDTIQVKNITRIPGLMTKVLVSSTEDNINPIGICIGLYSQRRNNLIEILKGEKVDFVLYKRNITEQVERCFTKFNIYKINVCDDYVQVVVEGDMKTMGYIMGIGKSNIRLISELLEHEIRVISLDDYKNQKQKESEIKIKQLVDFGISNATAETVVNNYIDISNVVEDNTIPVSDQKKLKEYLQLQQDQQKEDFINKGGSEDLFLYKQLPIHFYFQLLKANICNLKQLFEYKDTPEKLRAITGLTMDICIYLLE